MERLEILKSEVEKEENRKTKRIFRGSRLQAISALGTLQTEKNEITSLIIYRHLKK